MQIHELNEYPLNPSEGDWLIVDTGKDTAKVNGGRFAYKTDMDVMQKEIANVITNNNGYKIDTLWTGTMSTGGDSASLSSPLSNYDYIDIYTYFFGVSQVYTTDASEGDLFIRNENIGDDTDSKFLVVGELKLVLSAQAVALEFNHRWRWSGSSSASASMTSNDSEMRITKIVGRKCVVNQTDTEVKDIRVGADGTIYPSAGGAVRDQVGGLDTRLSRYEQIFTSDLDQSVSNWLDEHPEATTTVEDDSLTTAKYKDGSITKEKLSDALNDYIYKNTDTYVFGARTIIASDYGSNSLIRDYESWIKITDIPSLSGQSVDVSTYSLIQGGCYNSATERVIVALVDTAYTSGVFVELPKDFTTVFKVSDVLPIGHANSLTYISETNKILCAAGGSGTHANKIIEINADNYTIQNVYDTYNNITPWSLGYDIDNDIVYYSNNSNTLVIATQNIETIHHVTIPNMRDLVECEGQGGFVKNGTYYILWSSYAKTYFSCYDLNTGELLKYHESPSGFISKEAEDGFLIDGKLYTINGQKCIEIIGYNSNQNASYPVAFQSLFTVGKAIPINADLNDYTTPGVYHCIASTQMQTLINCPPDAPKSGFTLIVMPLAYDHLIHIYLSNDDRAVSNGVYIRKSTGIVYNKQFNKWRGLDNTYLSGGNDISVTGIGETGLLTSSAKSIMTFIPTSIPVSEEYANNAICTGSIVVRQNGNYIIGSGSTSVSINDTSVIDSYSLSAVSGKLRLTINLVNAPANAINNDVVIMQYSGFKVSQR